MSTTVTTEFLGDGSGPSLNPAVTSYLPASLLISMTKTFNTSGTFDFTMQFVCDNITTTNQLTITVLPGMKVFM